MNRNTSINLSEDFIILGPHDLPMVPSEVLLKINLAIAVGKLSISKFRYGKKRYILEIYETEGRIRHLWD